MSRKGKPATARPRSLYAVAAPESGAEAARFTREQPPESAPPPRMAAPTRPGLIAWQLLGHRLVRSGER